MNTAIKRAFEILEYLTTEGEREGEGVSSIGRHLGIPKSSAFDVLETLTELGYLECLDSKHYRVSSKAAYLGYKTMEEHALWAVTRRHLERLNRELGYTVMAGIELGSNVILTDKLPPLKGMNISGGIGTAKPLQVSALGKAILSCHSDDEIEAIVGVPCFIPYTRNSIVNLNQLFRHVAAIRKNGYAVNRFEEDDYVYGIAAPVTDATGRVCEAIGFSAFAQELEGEDLQAIAAKVMKCAADISEELKNLSFKENNHGN